MTMPVTPPAEACSINIQSSPGSPFTIPTSPSALLPVGGYQLAPSGFLDSSAASLVSGGCSTSWMSCPGSGNISEQDGRLNPFLRGSASSQDAKYILLTAVWASLGLNIPGNPALATCGGTNVACATALSQLAVTGRQAYNSFISWDPGYEPNAGGPQVSELELLAKAAYTTPTTAPQLLPTNVATIPALPSTVTAAQLQTAATTVIQQAYTALWAIRSNNQAWRQFRAGSAGWIAVSGEDDTPHRPVNVPTAPFAQFDIAVPVTVNGTSSSLTTRYMIASIGNTTNIKATSFCPSCPAIPTLAAAPAIPTVRHLIPYCVEPPLPLPQHSCLTTRLSVPTDDPKVAAGDTGLRDPIIYIHGGGSRLEEADGMAQQLIAQANSANLLVISFDMPNSAYADRWLRGSGAPRLLDPSTLFEDNPPGNVYNYPILGFTMQFATNFIAALGQQGIIDPKRIRAVMGGSLGGNLSLLLRMTGQPVDSSIGFSSSQMSASPYNTQNPALTNPLPGTAAIVSWSPTSMVSYVDNAGTIVAHNLTTGQNNLGWGTEAASTRSGYFYKLYYQDSASFPANLQPDPEMWYRNDWVDTHGANSCKASFIAQSRFDRYEIYSALMRRWTTALDTEQAIFSFQTNTDPANNTYAPNYSFIGGRLLLASGACDDYDNNGNLFIPPGPLQSTGTCAQRSIGTTGSNVSVHQDIYGFTHDVANDMRKPAGLTLFINDTGHSIHDERPIFFAGQILNFLTQPDNNINITLFTAGDDVRWNSELSAVAGFQSPASTQPAVSGSVTLPLNYWFHPWPASPLALGVSNPLGSPNNPCGVLCTKLYTFDLQQNTIHNFTLALPGNVNPTWINSFQLQFVSGWDISPPGTIGYGNDAWQVGAIAACLPGSPGSFISDGFTNGNNFPTGTLINIQAGNFGLPATMWQPPSFKGTSTLAASFNNCQSGNTNPPPNSDVSKFITASGSTKF